MLAGIIFYPYNCSIINDKNMPTIFELFGLRFFFYADEHTPYTYMWSKAMMMQKYH